MSFLASSTELVLSERECNAGTTAKAAGTQELCKVIGAIAQFTPGMCCAGDVFNRCRNVLFDLRLLSWIHDFPVSVSLFLDTWCYQVST